MKYKNEILQAIRKGLYDTDKEIICGMYQITPIKLKNILYGILENDDIIIHCIGISLYNLKKQMAYKNVEQYYNTLKSIKL